MSTIRTNHLNRQSPHVSHFGRLRLLFVSQASPQELCNGTGLRVHHLARLLERKHDIRFLCGEDLPRVATAPRSLNARIRSALSSDEPYPFLPELHSAFRHKMASERFDAVVLFGAELLQYIDGCNAPIVADLIDEPALACFRALREQRGMAWIRAVKRFLEMIGYERRRCRKVSACLLVSDEDARFFQRTTGLHNATVVANGVDTEFFRPQGLPVKEGEIVFSGSMGFMPNVVACRHFAKHIFPRILKQFPNAHWTIAGNDPHPSVRALGEHPQIDVTGFVPDIRPYIERAAVVVSPLVSGTGIKNKVLEAWAMKKGVVATAFGCAGLEASDGVNLLVAEEPHDFAAKTVRLLRNPAEARSLGEAGYQTVVTAYSWEDQAAKFEQVLGSVLSVKQPITERVNPEPIRPADVVYFMDLVPTKIGGQELFARQLGLAVGDRGLSMALVFCSPPSNGLAGFFELPNVQVLQMNGQTGFSLSSIREMWTLLRRLRPTTVMYCFSGIIRPLPWIARLCGAQRIVYSDHASRVPGDSAGGPAKRFLKRLITKPVTSVVAVSEFVAESNRVERMHHAPIHVIPNAIDISRRNRSESRERFLAQHNIPQDRHIVSQLSWLIAEKGIDTLLRAAAIVVQQRSDVHFVIGGEGPGRAEYERLAEELAISDRVSFIGKIDDPLLSGFYPASDVFCLASRWREAWGLVLLEAMSFGVPVVATRIGGIPEFVRDGIDGFLPEGTPEAFANAITALLQDRSRSRQMGDAARRWVESEFEMTRIAERYADVLTGPQWRVQKSAAGAQR